MLHRRELITGLPALAAFAALKRADARVPLSVLGGGGRAPYLGSVATRTRVPNQSSNSFLQFQTRSLHTATDNVTNPVIGLSNWFTANSPVTELNGTGTITWKMNVEYPLGVTSTPVTWSGNPTIVGSAGSTVYNDPLPGVSIPAGAVFGVRIYAVCSVGIVFCNTYTQGTGEGFDASATSVTDQTGQVGANVTNNVGNTNMFYPSVILGMTRKPTIGITGGSDSRAFGVGDTPTTVGGGPSEMGEISRSLAAASNLNFVNLATSFDSPSYFATYNHTGRLAIAKKANITHLIMQGLINEIAGGDSAATIISFMKTIAGYYNVPTYLTTCSPYTTGTYTTIAGQTKNTHDAVRVTLNDTWRTALPSWASGYFEVANAVEYTVPDGGFWNCPVVGGGTAAAALTGDGLHALQAGELLIQAYGSIAAGVAGFS